MSTIITHHEAMQAVRAYTPRHAMAPVTPAPVSAMQHVASQLDRRDATRTPLAKARTRAMRAMRNLKWSTR